MFDILISFLLGFEPFGSRTRLITQAEEDEEEGGGGGRGQEQEQEEQEEQEQEGEGGAEEEEGGGGGGEGEKEEEEEKRLIERGGEQPGQFTGWGSEGIKKRLTRVKSHVSAVSLLESGK